MGQGPGGKEQGNPNVQRQDQGVVHRREGPHSVGEGRHVCSDA